MTIPSFDSKILEMNEMQFQVCFKNKDVFDAEIVVCMLIHNNGSEVSEAISSVRQQKTNRKIAILIIDGGKNNEWYSHIESFENIALVGVSNYTVAQARNLSHQVSNNIFSSAKWLCRLDADDVLDSQFSIEDIATKLEDESREIKWAIAGNSLSESGSRIDRINRPEKKLFQTKIILSRLQKMARGEVDAELPSCNLWIKPNFRKPGY